MVVTSLRHMHDLSILLEIAGLKRSTFYYHLGRLDNPDKYENIKEKIKEIYNMVRADMGIEGLPYH
jgi:putative transposase